MIRLTESLSKWGSPIFRSSLKHEIERLGLSKLPLQQGLSFCNVALNDKLSALILNVEEGQEKIYVKAGIFFTGVIAGCSCADDPTPIDEHTEYCEMSFLIDKISAVAEVELLNG